MKPVLVDTSVWRHFFAGRPAARPLADLLEEEGMVLVHPLVVGELVLGGLSAEQERLLRRLPQSRRVPYEEVLALVRRRHLVRRGLGYVDAELVASSLVSGARLWSLDAAAAAVAGELGVASEPGALSPQ
jgi:predicted nucleic acid-binding protein